jgi:RNA polymerase sigma-70 factor, ECF subfamily
MRVNERQLIRNASNGDLKSWHKLWDLWIPRLQMFLYRDRTVCIEDREDLIQDIMLAVFQNLKQFNPFYSPSTWIYTIARRKLIDWKRKVISAREGQRLSDDFSCKGDQDPMEIVSEYPGPEEQMLQRDQQSRVRHFIDSQTDLDRRILLLVCYEGMSGRAAARALGIPNGTVRDRLRRLKRELAKEVL